MNFGGRLPTQLDAIFWRAWTEMDLSLCQQSTARVTAGSALKVSAPYLVLKTKKA